MKITSHPYCTFCSTATVGTLMHSLWDCPDVFLFWGKVIKLLSSLTNISLPVDPLLHLLLDDSRLPMTMKARKLWLAGITTAKKLVVQRWLPPHDLSVKHWLHAFLDILYLELSSARVNHANPSTVQNWLKGIRETKRLLRNVQ